MKCPKCSSSALRVTHPVVSQSQLSRLSGSQGVSFVTGLSCPLCGYWKDVDGADNRPVRAADNPVYRFEAAIKTQGHIVAVKFYDSIVRQRATGASWYTITKMLNQAGERCQEKTLQRYFEREQARREQEQT